ncbi:hypothetical protein B0H10DRAFT_1909435 [Mycena sp. CBHHK59/15]|nr:hypothetical protein B0H10DRAFT_1909435 [Mycena sp. CBHHK59/15]
MGEIVQENRAKGSLEAHAPSHVLPKSLQISSICTTLIAAKKIKNLSLQVWLKAAITQKQDFKSKDSRGQAAIDFSPPYSIDEGSSLRLQVIEKTQVMRRIVILSQTEFTVGDAERMLGELVELQDHLVFADGLAEFRLSFSINPNASEHLIRGALDVASEFKNIFGCLARFSKFLDTLLEFGVAASEAIPIAKAVLASVTALHKLLRGQEKFDDDICALLEDMADSLEGISDVCQFVKLGQLKRALDGLDPLIRDTVNFISQYGSQTVTGRLVALTFGTATRDKIVELNRNFLSFKRRFDRGLMVQTGMDTTEITRNERVMEAHIRSLLDDSVLRQDDAILQRLKPVTSSVPRGQEGCLEETRMDILSAIHQWTEDLDGPNVLWLHGHPGTGKSAIATTVRVRLQESGRLGSSYFFKREDFAYQTPEALWCSVAYDLAQRYPAVRIATIDKLRSRDVDPEVTGHYEVFMKLIAMPLAASPIVAPGSLPVIIIDALDECGGLEESRSYQTKVLRAITHWMTLPPQFKMLITSRSETNIRTVLGASGHRSMIIEVGDAVSSHSSSDIRRYLRYGFNEILEDFKTIPRPWPNDSQLEVLTVAAAGLFIWASTILKVVGAGQPQRELNGILEMIRAGSIHGNMDLLGQLYEGLLASKFRTMAQITLFKEISGAIIVARIPLSPQDFTELLFPIDATDIEFVCKQLSCVLDARSGLRFVHQSFVDFLVNYTTGSRFHCDIRNYEQKLCFSCFATMQRRLHFNIGHIQTSYFQNADIRGLTSRIPPYLYYSCRFWSAHLKSIKFAVLTSIHRQVNEFMRMRFLFWLEVLSIVGDVGVASDSIDSLIAWIPVNSDDMLEKQAKDALSFLRSFATPISCSVPHIYLSAVAFAPKNSIIASNHVQRGLRVIKCSTGADLEWHVLQGVLQGHTDRISSVAFSTDDKLIVSGSYDNTVRLWDAETQQQISPPLYGHDRAVISVAFSQDGQHIFSGSRDRMVRLWDVKSHNQVVEPRRCDNEYMTCVAFSNDGGHIVFASADHSLHIWNVTTRQRVGKPLCGHRNYVACVAFSPDGRIIASGSSDATVRIWDAAVQKQIGESLRGHDGFVRCVAFTKEGRYIASGSSDYTIRVWDVGTQQQIGEPLRGHKNSVNCLAFSPDGRHIVSGSRDRTVRIWSAETHQQVGAPLDGHNALVRSVAFSCNGNRIVSGSDDYTIRIWNADTSQQTEESVEGGTHFYSPVIPIILSHDSRYIVSGASDYTVCVWDIITRKQVGRPLRGHNNYVTSLALSDDGSYILSGSADCTVRIWQTQTQTGIGEALCGHDLAVNCVAFSHDARYVVSGSDDCTIRIWSAQTQKQIGEPLRGHVSYVTCIDISHSNKYIVPGSYDSTIYI